MIRLLAALAGIASAAPALAHDGVHIHPHADSPVWWPVIAGVLAIALAATLIARRK